MSSAAANSAFSAFAFLGFLGCSVPLYWHLEAWNTGTCLYMLWTGLACLMQFINSIVWRGNAINWAPVWCDISTKFMIGSAVGIPAASLCINRRLYQIASIQVVTTSKAQRLRAVMVDLAIGLGIPVVEMILHYIVQGHRFNIFEDIGCFPDTVNSWPSYVLVFVWPIPIGMVSAVYCILTLRAFAQRRSNFSEFLSSNRNLNISRYFRLMSLSAIEVLCTIPLGIFAVWLNASAESVDPWVSEANTHYDFSRVEQIPTFIWSQSYLTVVSLESSRWLIVVCAGIFFAFFGFADEARRHYRMALWACLKPFGFKPPTPKNTYMGSSAYGGGSVPAMKSFTTGKPISFPSTARSSDRDRKPMRVLSYASSIGNLSSSISINDLSGDDEIKLDVDVPSYASSDAASTSSPVSPPDDEYPLGLPHLHASAPPMSVPQHSADAPEPVRPARRESLDGVCDAV